MSPFAVRGLVFLVAFAVYFFSPVLQISDSRYVLLTSEDILLHRSVDLSYFKVPAPATENPERGAPGDRARTYQLRRVKAGIVTYFPHGSSFLSAPFVAAMNLLGLSAVAPDGTYSFAGEMLMQKMLAALLTAALVAVLFDAAASILPLGWAIIAAAGVAFGTQLWSTASRAMWSHTWMVLLGGAVVHELLRAELHDTDPRPIVTASLLSWMYFTRPTASAQIAAVTIYVAILHRPVLAAFVTTGAAWCAAFVGYSLRVFGTPLPPYYVATRLDAHDFPLGLLGNLVSPSRGLMVTVPIVVWVGYLTGRYWKTLPHRNLATLALGIFAAQTLIISSFPIWWGGRCYGARFFTDIVPWLFLVAILAIRAMLDAEPTRVRKPVFACGALLLALSIAINARGALSYSTLTWVDLRPNTQRTATLDWSAPQFMAGMFGIR